MVALGGRGDIAPTNSWPRPYMGVSGQRHAPAALCPGEWTPGTHCTGGWVGPRPGLDTEDRGKILCACRGSTPDRPVVQSVVRHWLSHSGSTPHSKDLKFRKKSDCFIGYLTVLDRLNTFDSVRRHVRWLCTANYKGRRRKFPWPVLLLKCTPY
jgi:hypothetical protein